MSVPAESNFFQRGVALAAVALMALSLGACRHHLRAAAMPAPVSEQRALNPAVQPASDARSASVNQAHAPVVSSTAPTVLPEIPSGQMAAEIQLAQSARPTIVPKSRLFNSQIVRSSSSFSISQRDTISPLPFTPGEKLSFVLKYEFIAAGSATLEVSTGPTVDGRETLRLESHARSTKFVDVFFKVRDYNASVVDRETLMSMNFHQNLEEGGYHVMRNTSINYAKGIYTLEKISKGQRETESGYLNEPASDILSAFFYARILPLRLGHDYEIRVFSDKKIYSLLVRVSPELHTVKVPGGQFECIQIQPFVIGDAIFKLEGGRMIIWLTNDSRRIPVLIRSKAAIGAFDAELTSY